MKQSDITIESKEKPEIQATLLGSGGGLKGWHFNLEAIWTVDENYKVPRFQPDHTHLNKSDNVSKQ